MYQKLFNYYVFSMSKKERFEQLETQILILSLVHIFEKLFLLAHYQTIL